MKRLLKRMLTAVITVLLVFGVISCGGGKNSPSTAARAFCAAVEKGDSKSMEKVATPQTVAIMSAFGEKGQKSMAEYGKIADTVEKIDGDTATVTVTFANGKTENLSLIKVDGKWKVNVSK